MSNDAQVVFDSQEGDMTQRLAAAGLQIMEVGDLNMVTGKVTLKHPLSTEVSEQYYPVLTGRAMRTGQDVIVAPVNGSLVVVGPVIANNPDIYVCTGSPNGQIPATVGSLCLRTDGSTGTAVYYKASGSSTSGWVAITDTDTDTNTHIGSNLYQPVGLSLDPVNNSVANSNTIYAIYMGRANDVWTSASVRLEVMQAAATITWAEVAIGTAPDIVVPGNASITTRGFTNVASSFNSTGEKTVSISLSGITVGANIWLMIGSQATTPFEVQAAIGGFLSAGQMQFRSSARPSTMAAGAAFTAAFNNAAFFGIMSAAV